MGTFFWKGKGSRGNAFLTTEGKHSSSFLFRVISTEHPGIWQCILKMLMELFFTFIYVDIYKCFASFFQVDKYTKPFSSLHCI